MLPPDRYAYVQPLGGGATGEVDLVSRRSDRRAFAVKWARLQTPAARVRFAREQRLASELRHPHLLSAVEVGEVDGRPYVLMPFLPGGTLRERVAREGALPPRTVVALLAPVADALHLLHQHDVVHRDVKPSNLLFDHEGALVLGDLGCAVDQREPRFTAPETLLGTLRYMAPEQRLDPHLVDGRADVYGLAATALFAIRGAAGRDLFAWRQRPEVFEGVPAPLVGVLSWALEYEPADRLPSAAVFAEELRTAAPLLAA